MEMLPQYLVINLLTARDVVNKLIGWPVIISDSPIQDGITIDNLAIHRAHACKGRVDDGVEIEALGALSREPLARGRAKDERLLLTMMSVGLSAVGTKFSPIGCQIPALMTLVLAARCGSWQSQHLGR